MSSSVLIVIPARYASTRFPGKPLALIAGVSLIERVYRRCIRACPAVGGVGPRKNVIIAADDSRIARHVRNFEGKVVMTRSSHPSGTDRVAEVARRMRASIIINVQGDEPLLDPRVIRQLIKVMRQNPSISMATLCHPIADEKEFHDPNVVKVVIDQKGNALYFSRSPIPHIQKPLTSHLSPLTCFRHIGLYAYRRDFLLRYVRWPRSPLEKVERLEQLRALEHGARIRVIKTNYRAIGVDVPADVAKVEKALVTLP